MENNQKFEYFEDFGYKCFGPILKEFSIWLMSELNKENIKNVFFLARDGMMIKKSFDLLNKDNGIKSTYLYASRRSIIVPSLWKLNNTYDIFKKISFNSSVKLRYFLKKVGLEDIDLTAYMKKYELSYESTINLNLLEKEENFNKFLDEIFDIIKENSYNEYLNMKNYLDRMNVNGKIAVVDIGWHGTMQKALCSIVDNADIYGYYMGIIPNNKDNSIKQKGFIFDENNNENIYNKFRYFMGIFEFMFLAREGSTKKYVSNNIGFELYEYEYKNSDEMEIADKIQLGALRYINSNNQEQKKCYSNLIKVMLNPSYKEATYFGNIKFQDEGVMFLAKPQKLNKYISNPKKLMADYKNSNWRIGFMKRLFVLPLPYYFFNEIIRKIYFRKG